MDTKEIKTRIKMEENRIERLQNKIVDIRFDIAATKKSLAFWKSQLKKAKK